MFDGHLLHWTKFWEQFEVAIHNKTSLSEAEKLVYLQHALKGGSAKQTIEGLSSSGDHYQEAVKCLKECYNKPRLTHQAHVWMIIEAPPLKDGTGRELRKLHDNVQQHIRALQSLGYDAPGAFLTSIIELKLDQTTMFEWQRHSQSSIDVPPPGDLLKFLDMRAQAAESSAPGKHSIRPEAHMPHSHSPRPTASKSVPSFVAAVSTPINCVVCKSGSHPLYSCTNFKALEYNEKMSTVKSNNLCLNCLHHGHRMKDCKSSHRYKQCQHPQSSPYLVTQ